MSGDPEKMLEIFFAIKPAEIEHDLRGVEINSDAFRLELAELHEINFDVRTPEIEARIAHLTMILAYALCSQSNVLPEVKTLYAAMGAGQVMQDAEFQAYTKGRLNEIAQRMEDIRKRDGLLDEEIWHHNTPPEDYIALDKEHDELSESITDTIFVYTLQQYRLKDQAELFENDRRTFEINREVGRRLLLSDKEPEGVEELMDRSIRMNYGEETLNKIRSRIQQIKFKL